MTVEFHELEIAAVTRETADCASFELSVPPGLREAYDYKAGQHLTFELPWEGFEVTRCYSLSSCPDLGEPLKIAVKRVEGGRVSNWMNDNLTVGDKIRASVPEGRFVLDPETRSGAPLFLFAGGSGITPIISLLKSAVATTKRSITLVYANQHPDSVIYADEIDRLVGQHPERLVVQHHYDSESGYLTSEKVRQHLHDTDIAEFYICGPAAFMELVEDTLSEVAVHEELVYVERFVSPADPDRAEGESPEVQSFESPDKFSLWLDGRSRSVPYVRGRTLLECAQAAGLNPGHSCESGYCGSCMAHVNTGQVHMRTHEALSERDIAKGVALLCQSIPASSEPLELDADSTSFRTASAVKSSYGRRVSHLAAAAVFAFMVTGTLVLRLVH
ncbi:MAG: ferredoxin--NADP reductase [Myxococcales bacterium]|nr:ferredoxin--NADP reductase [Myxococcales bacterium]MDH3483738.1 ferredoxin--NADP reductase [Myxococcales bacterium]